jgi:indolepyruvate decarboxylase
MIMRLGEQLLLALKRGGAREIFGIPGDFALPLFSVIEQSGILPLYTLSHEPAAAFAADAAARYNCGLGVVAVTYGAGALNVVNAIAGAYAEHSPVVVVSGAPSAAERASGLLLHHQVKSVDTQARIFAEITCDQAILDDPVRAPAEIARVLRSCSERSLPVYIEVPRDMATAACGPVPVLPPTPFDPAAVAACADEILRRVIEAERPVLLIDVEVRRHRVEDRVALLAQRLGLPVVTTILGRGLLSGAPEQVAGTYIGPAGDPHLASLVESSDCPVLLGVILSDTNLVGGQRIDLRNCVHAIDRQVRIGYHVYPDIPLHALMDALLARSATCAPRILPALEREPRAPGGSDGKLAPRDIASAIGTLFTDAGRMPMTADVGDCLFTAIDVPDSELIAPGYYAGMGFGVPAGLGLQATSGLRPLILVGDGAFHMTGWELGNCRRYDWDPIVVVLNNGGWEMLRAFRPDLRFNDLDDWQIAAIASSLGGEGIRVRSRAEVDAALQRAARTRGRFQLIEVMLERGCRSDVLTRFAGQVLAKQPGRPGPGDTSVPAAAPLSGAPG